MSTVNVGIIGLGTVGGGTAHVILNRHDDFLKHYGYDLKIKRACALEPERAAELGIAPEAFTTDWRDVVTDPDVNIVVELIGGDPPATETFEAALAAGKHVVTANKALLGRHVEKLAHEAAAAGVQIKCEAAAGGGIPIVNALEHTLVGNEILTVAGILNGTTNYILTRVENEGKSFDEVLADAQHLGYAEADPTADVDGFDAAAKVAILASIGFRTRVTTDDVHTEGIRSIAPIDFEMAHNMGCTIKLLGIARNTAAGVDARVQPTMIPTSHMLASVSNAMNAVYVVGDAVGETMFYGAGAGSYPTASAVVGDICVLAEHITGGTVAPESEPFERSLPVLPIEELVTRYYLRLSVEDKLGALAEAVQVFAKHNVSVARINQNEVGTDGANTLVFVTHKASERDMQAACAELRGLDSVREVAALIRIEDCDAWTDGVMAN